MSAHTPGPWHTIGTLADRPLVEAEDGGMVADLVEREDDAETRANAILISAAPELLEALKRIVKEATGHTLAALDEAQAAIAKAEGKP